jgi:hypothetical protein
VNNTTPRRLTCASIAPLVDGEPRIAPQGLGTWFSRWHHLYTERPVPTATVTGAVTALLPRPSVFTTAA